MNLVCEVIDGVIVVDVFRFGFVLMVLDWLSGWLV